MSEKRVTGDKLNCVITHKLKRVCGNCADYNKENGVCLIRKTIMADKTRVPMKRKSGQRGCRAFMYAR